MLKGNAQHSEPADIGKEAVTETNLYKLLGRPVVLFDVETTGINPTTDRVIEIAAISWDEKGRDEFVSVVDPGVKISEETTRLTGITQEQINASPTSEAVFKDFQVFMAGFNLLVAHNATFDLAFLSHELQRTGLRSRPTDFICTVALSVFTGTGINRPNRGGYMQLGTKLHEVAEALNLTLDGAHRAGNDIAMVELILPHLYAMALDSHKPILNAIIHRKWLVNKGQERPENTPPRAVVYLTA